MKSQSSISNAIINPSYGRVMIQGGAVQPRLAETNFASGATINMPMSQDLGSLPGDGTPFEATSSPKSKVYFKTLEMANCYKQAKQSAKKRIEGELQAMQSKQTLEFKMVAAQIARESVSAQSNHLLSRILKTMPMSQNTLVHPGTANSGNPYSQISEGGQDPINIIR
jgi:hypothetical protein